MKDWSLSLIFGVFFALLVLLILLCSCREDADLDRTSFLFRHFTLEEMNGELPPPVDFDVFSCTHFGKTQARVDQLLAEGYGCYRYVNILHCQPEAVTGEWYSPDTPWFNYLGQTVMLKWGAFLVNSPGDTAFFQYYDGDQYLIDWSVLTEAQIHDVAQRLQELTGPGCSLFIDHYWPTGLSGWMFSDVQTWYRMTPDHRERWKTSTINLVKTIRSYIGPDVITNGSWTAEPPIYLENSENTPVGSFQDALKLWRQDSRNVLSVRAHSSAWVDSAIFHWLLEGGNLAFSGGPVNEAYERAGRARALVEERR